jgi:hypothetical protein
MPIDEELPAGETQAVAQLTRLAEAVMPAGVVHDTVSNRMFSLARKDIDVREITAPGQAKVFDPRHVAQSVTLQTSGSLKTYINRFRNKDSVMFADIGRDTIISVIDYHGAGQDEVGPTGILTPKHNLHRATLTLAKSKEWAVWTSQNEKLMSHEGFASFLEENALDVLYPHGGDLLELCRDLNVKAGTEFKSSIRMGDTVKFEFKKDSEIGELQLPSEFTISIPVYFGEPAVTLRCLTRRKLDDGHLFLGFKIVRLENVRQADFQRIVSEVQFDTSNITTVYGTP